MRNDDGMMTLDGPGVHRRTPDIPYGLLEPLRSNYNKGGTAHRLPIR